MKVLHILNEIKHSGAEIMYANAAPYFQEKGIKMYALSTGEKTGDFSEEFIKNGIEVHHRYLKSGLIFRISAIKFYFNFYRFVKKNKIDILHIHRSDLFVIGFIARIAGLTVVMTMHNVFKHRKFTYPYGRYIRLMSRKIFQFKFQTIGESVYENELYYYHNPSVRINNWYDSKRFYEPINQVEKTLLREKLGILEDQFAIVSVGNCSDIKNHSDILKALGELSDKLNFVYLHLGNGDTENEEKELAISFGIKRKVRFLGTQYNVRDYLVASDVYVMTSKFEGLTIAGIEAMACGLPSILYNAPGLKDLIKDDKNGLLIPPDYNVLASKILFLKSNLVERKKMADNAVKFVKSEFSISKNVEQIVQLYEGQL